jgi:hypothetical protein
MHSTLHVALEPMPSSALRRELDHRTVQPWSKEIRMRLARPLTCLLAVGSVVLTVASVHALMRSTDRGPLYSVATVQAGLAHHPDAWVGRTMWVLGPKRCARRVRAANKLEPFRLRASGRDDGHDPRPRRDERQGHRDGLIRAHGVQRGNDPSWRGSADTRREPISILNRRATKVPDDLEVVLTGRAHDARADQARLPQDADADSPGRPMEQDRVPVPDAGYVEHLRCCPNSGAIHLRAITMTAALLSVLSGFVDLTGMLMV